VTPPPGGETSAQAPDEASVRLNRRRALMGGAVIAIALAGAGFAVSRERHAFKQALEHIGIWSLLASFICALVGIAATFPSWREVLDGLGVRFPWAAGARVFFTTQLGKYVPGSVWPVLMQMEAGRSFGASRRTMLGANIITIILNCCVGLIVAFTILPVRDAQALDHYWWTLLTLPLLLVLLHPRALPGLIDRAFVLLGRPALGRKLDVRSELRASAWSLLSWVALGAHLGILCINVGSGGFSTLLLATGAMALAVSLGVLFIPAPAGAGIRDAILVLVLSKRLGAGPALAVVVASRAILIACDLTLAALAALTRRRKA
jgi:hypothetical protein